MNHPKSSRDNPDVRLEELIRRMPADRQWRLLKELGRSELEETLLRIIRAMPDAKKQELLKRLEIDLGQADAMEETEIALRGYHRKSCMLRANYMVGGQAYESFILDISPAGAFVETRETFAAGQPIQLAFMLPNNPGQLTLEGEIIWQGMLGIGIRFRGISEQQKRIIQEFMETEEQQNGSPL